MHVQHWLHRCNMCYYGQVRALGRPGSPVSPHDVFDRRLRRGYRRWSVTLRTHRRACLLLAAWMLVPPTTSALALVGLSSAAHEVSLDWRDSVLVLRLRHDGQHHRNVAHEEEQDSHDHHHGVTDRLLLPGTHGDHSEPDHVVSLVDPGRASLSRSATTAGHDVVSIPTASVVHVTIRNSRPTFSPIPGPAPPQPSRRTPLQV